MLALSGVRIPSHALTLKEDNMRTVEKIRADYEKAVDHNQREKLKEEYNSTLPVDKQLAILLHSKLCKSNHTDACGFYYEENGLDADWSRFTHNRYHMKAIGMLTEVKKVVNKPEDEVFKVIKVVLGNI